MKKFMTIAALAAFAVGAKAATIYWGLGADVYVVDPTSTDYASDAVVPYADGAPSVASGSYLALVYLGQDVTSFDIKNITANSIVVDQNGARAVAPYALDTDGATYADYDPYSVQSPLSANDYDNGSSFGVVWYNASLGAFDYVYSIDDGTALNTKDAGAILTISDMARGSGSITIAGDTTGYGGILTATPVPEPGIACMALLGLGMMLKRRRA